VSARAISFTQFNAQLNGLSSRLVALQGDGYEPVRRGPCAGEPRAAR
jgi:methylase of polypeptide subunit release factors